MYFLRKNELFIFSIVYGYSKCLFICGWIVKTNEWKVLKDIIDFIFFKFLSDYGKNSI